MLRSFLLGICLLVLSAPVRAGRQPVSDSLWALLRQPGLADTTRVQALTSLCTQINRTDVAEARQLGQQALALARRLHYRRGEALAYHGLAATAFYAADYVLAQQYFTQTLAAATATGQHRLEGHAYLGLGNVAGSQGDLDRAVGYFGQARAAYAACQPPNLTGEALALNNIAGYLMNADRLREAARPVRQGLALSRQLHYLTSEVNCLASLGRLQNFEGHPDSAIATWHAGRRLAHEQQDYLTESQILINEADLLLARGEARQALALAQESARLARRSQGRAELSWALNYMARAMHQLGQPAAYDTLNRHLALLDSLNSEERQQTIAQLQVKFDVSQQQARIRGLEQQRRIGRLRAERQEARTRLFGLVAAGLLLIVVGGSVLMGLLVRSRRRLQTSESALREANATQEQLMRIIGHDLRAPVASFQQLTPLLHDVVGQPDPADAHALIGLLDAGSQQLGALVDNLLHWTRVRSGLVASAPSQLRLDVVVRGTAALYEPVALLKGVALTYDLAPALPAWADQDLLATVLRNLLSNAIKFTPAGGTVQVRAYAEAAAVMVEVRDSGVGIPPARLAELFEAERAASTPGTNGEAGTGLGLPLCARFVRLLGSELRVEPNPGAGTRFWFRLPTAAQALAAPSLPRPTAQPVG